MLLAKEGCKQVGKYLYLKTSATIERLNNWVSASQGLGYYPLLKNS